MAKEGEETTEKEVMEAAPPAAAENKEEDEVVHADTTTVADKEEEVQKERAAPSGEKPKADEEALAPPPPPPPAEAEAGAPPAAEYDPENVDEQPLDVKDDATKDQGGAPSVPGAAGPAYDQSPGASQAVPPAYAQPAQAGYGGAVDQAGEVDPMTLPRHGSEVFVGNLPMYLEDYELTNVFTQHPEASSWTIKEVRVPTDPNTGQRRQFGFVMLGSPEEAEKCIKCLEGYNLRGNMLRVKPSQTKNRLFIGGLPKEMQSAEFEQIVRQHGVGIEELELVGDTGGMNKGFGFATFYNHTAALMTKKRLEEVVFGTVRPNIEFS
eukprot:CAMPEP_0198468994 /NCGR_PEP_ID=MMETSP1456-20131121/10724_1 /TAXON_ID=1461544 ORGANISM="Unidentified sp., Strain RCC1871" /NCGR_SAMPLE_ID=MMETSP1456 /ASSEMBLY_ACC=CAM_ASM_001119 /LENGTH=322 /DNA_ID=CAMNT_0044195321 /DNA_START=27 /DNA_END=991 /DNA_ORIENTATION=-